MDLSHLDQKYFIDPYIYNCPFCKRNHVSYELEQKDNFDWTDNKKCYFYIVKCNSCQKKSLHLSYNDLLDTEYHPDQIFFKQKIDLDSKIFFSQPSSFFALDNRIPRKIRELIFEAEKSRQANLLVGASACLRKAIYELLVHEKSIVKNQKNKRADYQASINNLKIKLPSIEPSLFNTLGDIQEMTSDNVHEGSWEAWDSKKLRFIIELTKIILHEIYVVPKEREKRLGVLSQMKSTLTNSQNFLVETGEREELKIRP